ncbi:hypothetical protein PMG11_08561 [Penicillium brasilianum]|uniref:Thymidylate kinase n=1 Tax=Penicillium brasilianum TaxID=104259 RepID=A0A0F7TT94_PENBI|nr:hypothetical protein PMG11_08561 [Penicillium brasilianum]
MAALTMTPPTRQPFASLDSPRMRPFVRSKLNRQNQLNGATFSAKSSIFIDNAENIDPNTLNLSGKRKRSLEDDDDISKGSPKPLKTSRMALSIRDMNFSPRLSTPSKLSLSTPKSAPILKPAGRSPPPKSLSASRRSTITKARPEPSKRGGVARPFSLATALSHGKNKTTTPSKPKGPASWFFDIHVDSEQEEMTNLMQHSTGVLDISDDESKTSTGDDRGKENVAPAELGIDLPRSAEVTALITAAATRKANKMDEDRSPLGELNAADYYPEDCNAFSFAVVYDDDEDGERENGIVSKKTLPSQSTFVTPVITTSIASVLETVVPDEQAVKSTDASNESGAAKE